MTPISGSRLSKTRFDMPSAGICSHRGENRTHPENTLAAFRESIRVGAHQIEWDIYLTDSGDLVVIHDPTVDRTTDGTGDIRKMPLSEIKQLDAGSWKSPRFAGERIPTLDTGTNFTTRERRRSHQLSLLRRSRRPRTPVCPRHSTPHGRQPDPHDGKRQLPRHTRKRPGLLNYPHTPHVRNRPPHPPTTA